MNASPYRVEGEIGRRPSPQMQAQMEVLARAQLVASGFAAEGQPPAGTKVNRLPMAGAFQIPLEAANESYEDPTRVVNVSIDVGVKKQKPQREGPRMCPELAAGLARPHSIPVRSRDSDEKALPMRAP